MKKILCIFGTRPEAIKMAPVIQELRNHPEEFSVVVCVTAQHRDMLDQVLRVFSITPDYDLDIMQPDQTLAEITSKVLRGVDTVVRKESPDWILVQGDTTTALAAALSGFYNKVRIGHIEAGLRTGDIDNPFPEEANRKIVDAVSSILFAPTQTAKENLLREGVRADAVYVTGNTVIDAMYTVASMPYNWRIGPLAPVLRNKKIILATTHRRESFGAPIARISTALRRIAQRHDDVYIIFPVHPNPHVRKVIEDALRGMKNVLLVTPLPYIDLVHVLQESYLVATDSGGIQEEAPAFGKPVLVLREQSERPEGIAAGVARLVGTDTALIESSISELLTDPAAYATMARVANPYGDGTASKKIAAILASRI